MRMVWPFTKPGSDSAHFQAKIRLAGNSWRCYVLIDLKIGKLTHQDLGQMQMYVNYFDRHEKMPEEKPTVGIILCKQKNKALNDAAHSRHSHPGRSLLSLTLSVESVYYESEY